MNKLINRARSLLHTAAKRQVHGFTHDLIAGVRVVQQRVSERLARVRVSGVALEVGGGELAELELRQFLGLFGQHSRVDLRPIAILQRRFAHRLQILESRPAAILFRHCGARLAARVRREETEHLLNLTKTKSANENE